MARRLNAWLTPDIGTGETLSRCITMPIELLPYVTGALSALTEPWRWEQFGTMTPSEAAYLSSAMLAQFLNECEGSGMFDLRLNPTDDCEVQKTVDGGQTWEAAFRLDTDCALTRIIRNPSTGEYGWNVEDVGFYKFPDGPYVAPTSISYPSPPPASGTTDNDKRCNAAYGAAIALQALYRQTWDAFTRWATEGALLIAEEMMELADNLFRAVGGVDLFAEVAQDLYAQSAAFVDGGFPDSELSNVTEILYCASSVTDGVVTFDFSRVVTDFGSQGTSPYAGLNFLLQLYLGEAGLNRAGGVKASSPFNCSAEYYCSQFPEQDYEVIPQLTSTVTYLGNNWYRVNAGYYTGNYKAAWVYRTKSTQQVNHVGRIYEIRLSGGPYTSWSQFTQRNFTCRDAACGGHPSCGATPINLSVVPTNTHTGCNRLGDMPSAFSVEFMIGPCTLPT